jgi:putative dimethyl sulfoxide reductase chaperone
MMLTADIAVALSEDAATLALLQDRELTAQVLSELHLLDFPGNLALLPHGEAATAAYGLMSHVLTALPAQPDMRLLDELAADYAAIYLTGAFGASPCESFWVSDDHLVCQQAMFDVREVYAAAGLGVPDWRKRPDDHLVFQLQFLASRLGEVQTDGDWRALAGFLDFHLLRWLPDFAGRVATRCDTPFYAALVLLSDAWCQQLRDLVADHLGEARPCREEIEADLLDRHNAAATAEPCHFMPGAAGPSW